MKRIVDYLKRAIVFDRLAVEENNPEFRIKFEEQAGAYRKIAANRAEKLASNSPKFQTETPGPGWAG
jgi:hypothetical protein